jgi:putative aminopeptidase FrvX
MSGLQLLLSLLAFWMAEQKITIRASTPGQIKQQVEAAPCTYSGRLDAVRALFTSVGTPASDLTVERFKISEPHVRSSYVENLLVRKNGSPSEIVVVGAHYDKVDAGCGAIDNWTGVVALANLYASLKDVPLSKTYIFVAFGEEEVGLFGSGKMANAIPKDERGQYCAMVNIDSLGLAVPQVLENASTPKLRDLTEALAHEMKVPFGSARIQDSDSDSSSFLQLKIPAVTIHGLTMQWSRVLHTPADRVSNVNPESVYLGYRLALLLLTRIDQLPCDAFR